jgi:hypothetical protein
LLLQVVSGDGVDGVGVGRCAEAGLVNIVGDDCGRDIYLLLCEGGREIIGVPSAVVLFRAAGYTGSSGSLFRSPTSWSAAAEFIFLSHSLRAVGRCAFIGYASWRVAMAMDVVASPTSRFGTVRQGGRWIQLVAGGSMRRRQALLLMLCGRGGEMTSVVIFLCSRVLVAKCWGCSCNCTVLPS